MFYCLEEYFFCVGECSERPFVDSRKWRVGPILALTVALIRSYP